MAGKKLLSKMIKIKLTSIRNNKPLATSPQSLIRVKLPKSHPQDQLGPEINPKLSSASAKISLKLDNEKGRHVVANNFIAAGETLFVENPFTAVPTAEFQGKVCDYCLADLVAPTS
jgi:hypothetical protein